MNDKAYDYDVAAFDAVYRGEELLEGSGISQVPWDVNAPQPAIRKVLDQGKLHGRVLDVGCGLGENAALIAHAGLDVTALDAAPTAVDEARKRHPGTQVEFVTADALLLNGELGQFDSIVDSAVFHAIPSEDHEKYAQAMARNAAQGASFFVMTFADKPGGMPKPLSHSLSYVAQVLESHGWSIESVTCEDYVGDAQSVEGFLSRQGILPRKSSEGNNLLPCWFIHAVKI